MTSVNSGDSSPLTHVRSDGSSHMVDVSGKAVTTREAVASATLTSRADVIDRVLAGELPKGEALSVAHELIPLCHPLPITKVTVDFARIAPGVIEVRARVKTEGKTGVEMEALTAASVAALTVYDMVKAVDHLAVIGDVKVLAKSGGKSGDWDRNVASGEKGGAR